MRIVISDTSNGKSYQTELAKDKESTIVGKRLGDTLEGNLIGAAGYSFEFTGGSDGSGFPMKRDVQGAARKSSLMAGSVGFGAESKGERRRKNVRGNVYSSEIVQVNVKVTQAGPTPLDQLFPKKEKAEKEKK